MATTNKDLEQLIDRKYQHGFITDIESETVPPGLDEDVIRLVSHKKQEPQFMLPRKVRDRSLEFVLISKQPIDQVDVRKWITLPGLRPGQIKNWSKQCHRQSGRNE